MKASHLFPAVVLMLSLVAGCGSQHRLPEVSPDGLRAAAGTIAGAPPLVASPRSPADNGALLDRTAARLIVAAEPFCTAYLRRGCAFTVVHDAGEAGTRTASAEASGWGTVTVSEGMLRLLDNEDEAAAVVAHELGHHLAGHIGRGFARSTATGYAAGAIVGALVPFGGLASWAISQGAAQVGGGIARLSFSKEEEREADYLAAYLLARAGYDFDRAAGLWAKLAGSNGAQGASGLLATHPSSAERLAAWRQTVEEIRASLDLVPRRVTPATSGRSSGPSPEAPSPAPSPSG